MGDYNEELKRYCMMLAVKQREEEEREIEDELCSLFTGRRIAAQA
ncbi:MAG: hypothetical protein QME06_05830 [Desulfobacterales bacterium]|nr:hypothetical protein [Desulfobacterales bacterium]